MRVETLAETERLAQRLAPHAAPGDVIGLCGALGSGKTAFARAFIRARLGRPAEEVPSPTFTLVQLYGHAAGAIWHFDLYRLDGPENAYELGIEDAFSNAIALIEWPETLSDLMPADWLEVRLAPGEDDEARLITIAPHGPRARTLADALARNPGGGWVSNRERDREGQRRAFAARAGWGDATHRPLAGDASARRYERLAQGDATAVLMDDPPPGHSVGSFVRIALLLRGMGYSAPEIVAADEALGFALLEDVGDDSFSALLAGPGASSLERTLYEAATDVLIDLHRRPTPPDLPDYDPAWLLSDAALFLETAMGDAAEPAIAAEFEAAWRGPLEEATRGPQVLCLRDFHAGNLMWLPARGDGGRGASGIGQVGLLDFQDARAGPAAYDLVSLLQDARRDLGEGLEAAMVARYLAASPNFDEAAFRAAYAVLGAQRAVRIIGVFHRLAQRDGKPAYLAHLPRVWRHLDANLAHPALAPVRAWFDRRVPPPARGSVT